MQHLSEIGLSDALIRPIPKLARRSKGCLTCRQRKVKCGTADFDPPECKRCLKGFHNCQGYENQTIFVHSNITQKERLPMHSETRFYPEAAPERTGSTQPVPFLALKAFRDKIAIGHLFARFGITFIHIPDANDAPTISSIFHAADEESSAYLAGLAVSEALFGRLHSGTNTAHRSTHLYSRGLASLQSELTLPRLMSKNHGVYSLLWSSMFFAFYEALVFSAPGNWLQHCQGLLAVVGSQIKIIDGATACVVLRRRTFLEKPEWKSIPWGCRPDSQKTFRVLLDDIYCDISGFMEAADHLPTVVSETEKDAPIVKLRSKVIQALSDTESLRARWETKYSKACHEASPSGAALPFASPFDTIYRFSKPERAFEINGFNTIRLLLASLANQLGIATASLSLVSSMHASTGPLQNPLLPPGKYCPTSYALEICRTVEYMMDCEWDILGGFALLVPLAVASRQLRDYPDIQAWLDQVFRRIDLEKGFKIAEHVREMTGKNI
ncbi:C6 finger domain-containing protein [Cordyceps javanica]|uniref:C6 finger domain-containing protein n=1 Tax=Cordyceps javanica TaxID=43265 RepID=A0A545UQL9_9HYPO|nr:C6 finger domain-containing protein [Cordyceps javanica]